MLYMHYTIHDPAACPRGSVEERDDVQPGGRAETRQDRCCGCGVSAVVRWTLLLWVAKGAVVGVIALIAGPSGACQSGRPPTHTGCRRMQDPASTSARLFACTGALVPDSLHRLRTQTAGGANFPFTGLHHDAKMRHKPLASPRGGSLSPVVEGPTTLFRSSDGQPVRRVSGSTDVIGAMRVDGVSTETFCASTTYPAGCRNLRGSPRGRRAFICLARE